MHIQRVNSNRVYFRAAWMGMAHKPTLIWYSLAPQAYRTCLPNTCSLDGSKFELVQRCHCTCLSKSGWDKDWMCSMSLYVTTPIVFVKVTMEACICEKLTELCAAVSQNSHNSIHARTSRVSRPGPWTWCILKFTMDRLGANEPFGPCCYQTHCTLTIGTLYNICKKAINCEIFVLVLHNSSVRWFTWFIWRSTDPGTLVIVGQSMCMARTKRLNPPHQSSSGMQYT